MNSPKICTRCHNPYPATTKYFNVHRRAKDGLDCWCKSCKCADSKQYRQDNPEKYKEALRNSHKKYKSKRLLQQKKYRQDKSIQIRDQHREYSRKNRIKIRAMYHKYRARKRAAEGVCTSSDITAQYKRQKGKCHWCNKELSGYDIDHVIPLVRGGTNDPSNIVLACPHCNRSKGDKLPHEWLEGGRLC